MDLTRTGAQGTAAAVGRGLAVGRLAIGAAGLVAPRALLRAALAGPGPAAEAVTVLRMCAARDLALGLGALLAARRGPGPLRGWLEAGTLADGADAWALATATELRAPMRMLGAVVAAGATVAGSVAARRLT